ncbi:MAG: TM2 domain-containing protein [Dysgonomonas sp.]
MEQTNFTPEEKPAQQKLTMILVCWFLGSLGIHRYMMGYSNWWLMLITCGGCGIWTIIDLIQIITDKMGMADGRPLEKK